MQALLPSMGSSRPIPHTPPLNLTLGAGTQKLQRMNVQSRPSNLPTMSSPRNLSSQMTQLSLGLDPADVQSQAPNLISTLYSVQPT
mmetsp:Transcript_17343/g.23969  ORF Transcript_17343/g.23969 Transcript_17343/m.23969 type:complete len:86 (-) Transcript_17343:43-300(-)